jgi:ABC-type glycerol-3-phosphate transport system substrate-binding protein
MRLFRLVATAVLLLFAACGKTVTQKTTITWWQFWTNPEVKPTVERLVSDFESVNPDIDVQLGDLTWSDGHEKIAIALAARSGPDVIELGSDWVAEFAAGGKLFDLTAAVADLKDSLLMWEPGVYQGKCYAVPWMLGTRVLFCNRTLLKQAGYDDQFAPTTWGELLEASARIRALDDDTYGFASNAAERHRLYKKYLPFFWSAGGEVFNADQTATQFDTEAGSRSLEYYLKLSMTGLIETQSRLEDYFAAGKVGFMISGEWLVKRLSKGDHAFDYFVTAMPSIDGKRPGVSFAGGEYLVVNSATKSPEACTKLLHHLVTPGNDTLFANATGSFTPVNIHSMPHYDSALAPIARVFRQQLRNSRSTPTHPGWVSIEEVIEKGIEQALYRKVAPAEALKMIDTECAAILQRYADK